VNKNQALTRQDILNSRHDLSPFLVHLTRTGPTPEVTLSSPNPEIRPGQKNLKAINAKQSLESILSIKVIEARNAFSFFKYKVPIVRNNGTLTNPGSFVKNDWLKSVCFTETPLAQIRVQCQKIEGRDLYFQPFGIAFHEKAVRRSGGNPLFYFESFSTVHASLDALAVSSDCERLKSTLPFFESYGRPLFSSNRAKEIDFRWEREWRVVGDFLFTYQDIAYGLCPEHEISYFESLTENQVKFVDPHWEMDRLNHLT
jgi:hypothetical protein